MCAANKDEPRVSKQMNWKRGLLRLWIFVSVLWLAGASSIAVLESSPVQQQRIPLTEDELAACEAESSLDAEPIDPERPLDFSQYGTPPTDAPKPSASQFLDNYTPPDFSCYDTLVEYVRDWNLPEWRVMAAIISVPALVLGLGAAVAWVIIGFRDPRKHAAQQSGD